MLVLLLSFIPILVFGQKSCSSFGPWAFSKQEDCHKECTSFYGAKTPSYWPLGVCSKIQCHDCESCQACECTYGDASGPGHAKGQMEKCSKEWLCNNATHCTSKLDDRTCEYVKETGCVLNCYTDEQKCKEECTGKVAECPKTDKIEATCYYCDRSGAAYIYKWMVNIIGIVVGVVLLIVVVNVVICVCCCGVGASLGCGFKGMCCGDKKKQAKDATTTTTSEDSTTARDH